MWGVNPTGQLTGANFTEEDLEYAIENQTSDNIRPDRQTAELTQVAAECSGGFTTEFQSGNIDDLIPGFFMDNDDGWKSAIADDSLDFTVETGSGVGGTVVFASVNTSTLVVGQPFFVAGSSSNNGWFTVKSITNATTIIVHQPCVTEASVACTIGGEWVHNGVFRQSFTIERANYDISQFFTYVGMVPNTLEFTIESGSPVIAATAFVGKNETLKQASPNTPVPTTLSTTPIINAVSSVGDITVDDSALESCLLQSVSLLVDNQVEGKTGIGVLGFCNANAKSLMVTGSIVMYFNNETYYKKYLDSTSFGLNIPFMDALGNHYLLRVPKCKFDTATANVTGKDDDVLVEGSYVAIIEPDSQYTVSIAKVTV